MGEVTQALSDALEQEPLRFNLTVLGETYQAVLPSHGWTYQEAKFAKAIAEGLAPSEIGERFVLGDPDAIMAVVRVTLMRAGRKLSQADLNALEQIDLEEIGRALLSAIQEKLVEADPPAPATAGSPEPTENGSLAHLPRTGEASGPGGPSSMPISSVSP